jgi:phosphoglycolate phosphatase
MNKPKLELLVFDWDGTLMDSIAAIVGCMTAAVDDLGLGPVDPEKVRRFVGLGLSEALPALGLGDDAAVAARLVERYRHHWFATYRERPVLFAGVPELIAALAERGYLLAIATGKGRRGLDRDLETTRLMGRFHSTRTIDEAPSKPHPQMLLDVMESLGTGPHATLMIGDTPYDLRMAKSAGAHGLGVAQSTHPRQDLLAEAPLGCLDDIRDLLPWLDSWSKTR